MGKKMTNRKTTSQRTTNKRSSAEPFTDDSGDSGDELITLVIPVCLTKKQYLEHVTWTCHVCGTRGNKMPSPCTAVHLQPNNTSDKWQSLKRAKRICSWGKEPKCPGDPKCGDGPLGHRGPCPRCGIIVPTALLPSHMRAIELGRTRV